MARRGNDGQLFSVAVEQEFQVVDDELMEGREFEGGHHRLREPAKRPPCQGQPENLGRDHTLTVGKKATTDKDLLRFFLPAGFGVSEDFPSLLNIAFGPEPHFDAPDFLQWRGCDGLSRYMPLEGEQSNAELFRRVAC